MRRTNRRPAPQQHIKPDTQVNEGDEPQPIVHGAFGRNENDFDVQRNRSAHQGVRCLRPDAGIVKLASHRCRGFYRSAIDAENFVSPPDSCPFGWTIWLQPVGHHVAVTLDPPCSVVGNRRLMLDSVVETGEKHRGHSEQCQQDGSKPSLKFAVHERGQSRDGMRRDSSLMGY